MLEAIAAGHTDLVFAWLDSGGSAAARDPRGVSLAQWCAYYGDASALRWLLLQGADLASLGPNLDLNGAAFHGHWRLCAFLIERGADPNAPLPDTGETPLHAALCRLEDPTAEPVVEVLLAAGADPDLATIPHVETGGFARDVRTVGETALHRAAAYATEAVIRRLLAAGARVDARDVHGDSPLTWASRALRPQFVLDALCFGSHRIHPVAVEASRHAPVPGRIPRMSMELIGGPRR